ncbi:MAG: DUF4020 domain-containing protein [Desulfuromonadaceae bacterium]|nr:DUF4020 domain-containing protein [Desulfuromonadaceae bacterium]
MRFGSIDIPQHLLDALKKGKLVVFAGAGVSMGEPANLPDFWELASYIADGTGKTPDEPFDRFLGKLHHSGVDVHSRAAARLNRVGLEPTELHRDLLKLFPTPEKLRLVTTNFDLLFEKAAESINRHSTDVFRAPALPLGRNFYGIVHLHGAVNRAQEMVLTDEDFGKAYLTEGWARRFLLDVFRNFTVLFVGYSHDDVVMHYLGRALPVAEVGKRYALTHEGDDLQRWDVLGIKPLTYQKADKNDFSQLYQGIQRLTEFMSRNLLDWRRELAEIAIQPPAYSDEEETSILLALEDVAKTRFFTEHARSPAWLLWLDKRRLLDPLFESATLTDRDREIAWWLAKHYAVSCVNKMFLLIAGHGMRLNADFWEFLGREVGLGEEYPLDETILSKWVSMLLATAPSKLDDHVLLWLGERCIKLGSLQPLLRVFDAMAGSTLSLKHDYMWDNDGKGNEARIKVELQPSSEHYAINELWERGLRPNLAEIAEQLLSKATRHLEDRHLTLRAWQTAENFWDADNWHRSAIEPHEQDRNQGPIDVLIDAARDSLEWLTNNRSQLATNWCERLITSQTPLLRRLSIHTSALRTDITADDKLGWLLKHTDLHESSSHHEHYIYVRKTYPEASAGLRDAVIESIKSYAWPDHEDPEHDQLTIDKKLNWLSWLKESDPNCKQAQSAFDDIQTQHPEFRSREHSDMTRWMRTGSYESRSPWTSEELLSRPAGEWLPELIGFQEDRFSGPNRYGLINAISDASKEEFGWGIELAKALAANGLWGSDLWAPLFRVWQASELDKTQLEKILSWLSRRELYHDHALDIAQTLNSLVENGGRPYALDLLPHANAIASEVWQKLDRTETRDSSSDWLSSALNRPAGVLTQFFLGGLSLWRKGQELLPSSFNELYQNALTDIVEDKSLPGILGLSIIASQFPFLLAADNEWTVKYLLPLFSENTESQDYQAVWDGFMCWGHLNPEVAELLEPTFFASLTKFQVFKEQRRNRFIEFIAAYLVYYVNSPLTTWIPEFFRQTGEESRVMLASNIKTYLNRTEEKFQIDLWRRWIKKYWENRLQGVPAPISAAEFEPMLGWTVRLTAIFPEAVALATKMPHGTIRNSSFLRDLDKNELPQRYPNEVAQLIIYLGESGSHSYMWYGLKELVSKIKEGLTPELSQKLEEVTARLGI